MATTTELQRTTTVTKTPQNVVRHIAHSYQEVPIVQVRGREMGNKLLESIYM